MKKLSLDTLAVESFATVEMPRQPRGTVEGRGQTERVEETCGAGNTCDYTCYYGVYTCDPSCRQTQCITACQGGSNLSGQATCIQTE